MLTFEIDGSNEGIEVFLDAEGIEEMINYLNYIKEHSDHHHLIVGKELDSKLINSANKLVKHVKLVYLD